MKVTILVIIGFLGVLIPLLWITGTLTSAIYFCLQGVRLLRGERQTAFDPNLGLTMADGGDAIDKKAEKQE